MKAKYLCDFPQDCGNRAESHDKRQSLPWADVASPGQSADSPGEQRPVYEVVHVIPPRDGVIEIHGIADGVDEKRRASRMSAAKG